MLIGNAYMQTDVLVGFLSTGHKLELSERKETLKRKMPP